MVTAIKMSRPYTAIDLKKSAYRQTYLSVELDLTCECEWTMNGKAHFIRVKKSVLRNSLTLIKSNYMLSISYKPARRTALMWKRKRGAHLVIRDHLAFPIGIAAHPASDTLFKPRCRVTRKADESV